MKSILIALLLIPVSGCIVIVNKDARESGNHVSKNATRQFEIDQVHEVEFRIPGRLTIVFGSEERVRIEVKPGFVDVLQVTQDDHRLIIDGDIPDYAQVDVYLTIQSLDAIFVGPDPHQATSGSFGGELTVRVSEHTNAKIRQIVAQQININLQGFGKLSVDKISGQRIKVEINDHGKFNVRHMVSHNLHVSMRGHGGINLSGRTDTQKIRMQGYGRYDADALESNSADLRVRGYTASHLWVNGDLTMDVGQYASVRFRGEPRLRTGG